VDIDTSSAPELPIDIVHILYPHVDLLSYTHNIFQNIRRLDEALAVEGSFMRTSSRKGWQSLHAGSSHELPMREYISSSLQ
jgi:hypothetical protein